MSKGIEITLNGAPFSIAAGESLSGLIETMGLSGTRYAIEVNQEIVPRSQHDSFQLNGADLVEIVQAIGGG